MVREAKSFRMTASFGKPSLYSVSLSNIITSFALSSTSSKTKMTDLATRKARRRSALMALENYGTPVYEHVTYVTDHD